MNRRHLISVIIVVVVALFALVIALPFQHPQWMSNVAFWQPKEFRDLELKQGLDLQGGLQVLLEADPSTPLTGEELSSAMDAAKVIVDNRVNGLGVSEPLVQRQGENRIIVELPGIDDPNQAISTLRGTGLLEFVEMGQNPVGQGALIQTDVGGASSASATGAISDTLGLLNPVTNQPFHTIMTGAALKSAAVGFNNTTSQPLITFELNDEGRQIFRDYTASHIGDAVAIVMDKTVLSAPVIRSTIDGSGQIEGSYTTDEARSLAVQMQYGALPVALNVVDSRSVGATLGADSVQKSILAGVIGVFVVLLFMAVFYRLPGLLADIALITFILINLAVFKLIPITLTLAGIAGFLLAIGMAVDANVLIFERMKEEVRAGKSVKAAVDAGFNRAWTSILDSNLSTLITAGILYYFGGAFGASTVRGFAVTLIIGVLISMFTAVFVTRVLMRLVFQRRSAEKSMSGKNWVLGV
ncbi:MAG: protein translocase subunit SecD [Anaerolineae bacterium]|nr:protein translocase subunit SecD [Anaerolineae bacterium]MCB9132265.1 protein translocase subunit SecD [Anaerolineales bacterium]MCB0231508.1 protein translocase subunit SecD [Anaerolineae bacterium]MCB0233686.1 protein translocase subunit SecD [Anaerolineae bacterium]MCB0237205.1 protein translocase subunit SecD [Anaerolineae bacterium]